MFCMERDGQAVRCAPASPIAYYQQVGRAGFAGICKACDCTRSSARYYRNTPAAVSQQEREARRNRRGTAAV